MAALKAQFGIKWALIVLIVTVILIIAVMRPYQGAMEEAIRTSAFLNAMEISGIINILQSSPDETQYEYLPPDADCVITVGEDINFTIRAGNDVYTSIADVLKSDIEMEPTKIYCEDHDSIVFIRSHDTITIE